MLSRHPCVFEEGRREFFRCLRSLFPTGLWQKHSALTTKKQHTRTNTFPEEDEVHDPARTSVSTLNYRLKTRVLLHSEGVYISRCVLVGGAETLRCVVNLPVDEGLDGTSLKRNLTNVPPDAPKSQIFIRKQRDWPHKQLEQSCMHMESSG